MAPGLLRRFAPRNDAWARRFAPLSARVLRERLPATLAVAEERERKIYKTTDPVQIERVLKSFRDFVALCERKEAETGEPCLVIAIY